MDKGIIRLVKEQDSTRVTLSLGGEYAYCSCALPNEHTLVLAHTLIICCKCSAQLELKEKS